MGKRMPSKWLTLIAACFGLLMLYIDLFIVNVALPTIGHDFRAPLGTGSWTISGYVLMIGVLPMGIGRLGDLWGQRAVYLAGVTLFSIASLLCGLALSITALIVFRVIQGIGAAIMTPGTLAIIIRAFPPRQHGLAIGIYGGISGLGLIAGPVLGGLLVQGENWRPIFLVNVPLGVAALVMAALFVPQSREARDPVPVDWPGLTLLSSGLLCLLFGFTRASDAGWTNVVVIVSCLFGLVLLALFAMTERRVRWPLVDLALFRNRPFVMGCLSFFFFSAALFGAQPYWSLFLQNTWGLTPLQGGLAFLPATGLIALLTPPERAARTMGRASAVCDPCAGVAGHRGELFLCSGYPDPTEHLRWGIAPHLSRARSRHSRRLLLHDACRDERRPDEAVGAGLWNAWDGTQYRDRLWRCGAKPGLSLPYKHDAAIVPRDKPSSSRPVHCLWSRCEPPDDRSSDPPRI